MPKSEVTQAVYQYLRPESSGITYLGTVYTALPKIANESDLFTNSYSGLGLGAVIYMFFTTQEERRIALGGLHEGRKFRIYDLGLLIIFKSDRSSTEEGQAAFDEFIDSLTAWIQADRNAGNPSVIFQWGEGEENGGADLRLEYTMPRTLDGGVTLYQAVGRIRTCEILDT
jgi:hypothetical protein